MPNPTPTTTVGRPDLGAIAFEYMLAADQQGFIAGRAMPVFETALQSAQYPKIPIEAVLKQEDTARAPRGGYGRGDWEFEMDTYKCAEFGWEEPVDDSEAALFARFFDAEQVAVLRATAILLRGWEKRVADMLFNPANITNGAAVANEWDDAPNATPVTDIKTAKLAQKLASGITPNCLIICDEVFQNLLACQQITNLLRYTNPIEMQSREVQRRILAQIFGLAEVIVADGMYDTAGKGLPFSLANIWSHEYALLARISAGGQDLRDPCLGRSFLWTADSPQVITTEQYREDQTRSNIYRVRQNIGENFIFTGAGYLLSNITT